MTTASPALYYQLSYRHGVDAKRRVQIPSKWRPQDENALFNLLLWRKGPDACLLVLPQELMLTLVTKLKEMSFFDAKAEALRRLLATNSDQVSLDKSGRICIPEPLATGAGIEKEAVLVGMFDRFQIWNPERYDSASKVDDALSSEAYNLL